MASCNFCKENESKWVYNKKFCSLSCMVEGNTKGNITEGVSLIVLGFILIFVSENLAKYSFVYNGGPTPPLFTMICIIIILTGLIYFTIGLYGILYNYQKRKD